jgi:hypothetical protein
MSHLNLLGLETIADRSGKFSGGAMNELELHAYAKIAQALTELLTGLQTAIEMLTR